MDPQTASDKYKNNVVNQLLTLLSQDNKEVVIIATTNNYTALDSALIRAGRFDRHITISLPDLGEREKILRVHTQNKKLSNAISLNDLAQLSSGFSGAKIATWINEAALTAARHDAEEISMDHFDEARTSLMGVTRRNLNPIDKKNAAEHEAAHALIGYLLNQTMYKVSIHKIGNASGFTEWLANNDSQNKTQNEMLDQICTLLAGRAQEIHLNNVQEGSQYDLELARKIAIKMVQDEGMGSTLIGLNPYLEVEKILQEQLKRAGSLLAQHQREWKRIKEALLVHQTLRLPELEKVIHDQELSPSSAKLETDKVFVLPPPKKTSKLFSDKPSNLDQKPKQTTKVSELPGFLFEQHTVQHCEHHSEKDYEWPGLIPILWDKYKDKFKP